MNGCAGHYAVRIDVVRQLASGSAVYFNFAGTAVLQFARKDTCPPNIVGDRPKNMALLEGHLAAKVDFDAYLMEHC